MSDFKKPLSFEEYNKALDEGLDPMTMLPNNGTPRRKTASDYLGSTPSPIADPEELATFQDRGINVYGGDDVSTLQEARAEEQGYFDVSANAMGRYMTGLVPELVGMLGGAADAVDFVNADKEFGNALTRWSDEAKQTVDEEFFPIYRSKERGFMDIGDPEWWAENGSSVARSASSFAIGGEGVAKGLGYLGKASRGTALLEALGLSPEAAVTVGRTTQVGANAYLMNHAEGVMEATDVYNQTMDYWTNKGYTPDEAKMKASEAASATINANRVNVLLNLTSASRFLKSLKSTRNTLDDVSWKNTAKDIFGEGVQEAAEENINLLASEYGKAIGEGKDVNALYGTPKLGTLEGLESSFLGFLGGAAQTGLQTLGNRSKYNPLTRVKTPEGYISQVEDKRRRFAEQKKLLDLYEEMKLPENIKNKINIYDSVEEIQKNNQEYEKALEENNLDKASEIAERDLGYRASEAFNNGTTEQFIDSIQQSAKSLEQKAQTPAEIQEIQEKAARATGMIKYLENRYNNNSILVDRMDIQGNPKDVFRYKNVLKNKLNNLNTNIYLAKDNLNRQQGKLQEEMTSFDDTFAKSFLEPFVKKQEKELGTFGETYKELLNQEVQQKQFDKWVKRNEQATQDIVQEETKAVEADDFINNLATDITSKGYNPDFNQNLVELPDGSLNGGILMKYNKKPYLLQKINGKDVLVDVNTNEQIPFTKEFVTQAKNSLEVVPRKDVSKVLYQQDQKEQLQSIGLDSMDELKDLEQEDSEINPKTVSKELDNLYETAKSSHIFYSTGTNVEYDRENKEDKYNDEGIPLITSNTLQRNWFEFLDTRKIKPENKLMVLRYEPNSTDEKQKEYNRLIERSLTEGYIPSQDDIAVAIVDEDNNFVSYKDEPLLSFIPLSDNLLSDIDNTKVNFPALLDIYAQSNGYVLEDDNLQDNKVILIKDNKKEEKELTDDFKQEIINWANNKHKSNVSKLKTGDIIPVSSVTLGKPLKKKKLLDGKWVYDYRPFASVYSNYRLDNEGNPQNFDVEVVTGERFQFGEQGIKVPKGSVVLTQPDDIKVLSSRVLNDSEVNTILNLLSYAKEKDGLSKVLEINGTMETMGKTITSIPVFPQPSKADKFGKLSVLQLLINYGVKDYKNPELSNGDIFVSKGKVNFKFKDTTYSLPVNDILNDSLNNDLKEFLKSKRLNINKFLVESTGNYYHPQMVDGEMSFKKYRSYMDYVLNDVAITNGYRTPEGQTMAQRNVVFATDGKGDLVVDEKKEQQILPEEFIPLADIVTQEFQPLSLDDILSETPVAVQVEETKLGINKDSILKTINDSTIAGSEKLKLVRKVNKATPENLDELVEEIKRICS